ncbi:MAG: hypothetical protein JJE13_10355 [Thermoleophilia bacterium]|nr:hypothetical protein [Thermoleophilia bacterium]
MNWYEFDEDEVITCKCGWSGTSKGNLEIQKLSFFFECPECSRALAVFDYPTVELTKSMAASGNEKAKGELEGALRRENFLDRAKVQELAGPEQLPDLEGDDLVIEWDFEGNEGKNGDSFTILRHEGKEIWREVAYYEGIDRFERVLWILREKYGTRIAELRPTKSLSR